MKKLVLILTALSLSVVTLAQYPNLTSDISWSGGTSTIDEVEAAYNNARTEENTQLGTSLPSIDFPTQSEWDAMNDNEKALWIFNIERKDRGIFEFEGVDSRISDICTAYTQYLVDNDTSGHWANGKGIQERMEEDAAIAACNDHMWENIGRRTSNNAIPTHPLEQMIYYQIYLDASSAWGHRENVLDEAYVDNSGESGKEGLIGVGMLYTTNYSGGVTDVRAYAYVCTFQFLDPCSSWDFQAVGIDESTTDKQEIFPNPSNGRISFSKPFQELQIIDMTGKIVATHYNQTQVDISQFEAGVYFFNIDGSFEKVLKN